MNEQVKILVEGRLWQGVKWQYLVAIEGRTLVHLQCARLHNMLVDLLRVNVRDSASHFELHQPKIIAYP